MYLVSSFRPSVRLFVHALPSEPFVLKAGNLKRDISDRLLGVSDTVGVKVQGALCHQ